MSPGDMYLTFKEITSLRLWYLYVLPKTRKVPKDGPAAFKFLRLLKLEEGGGSALKRASRSVQSVKPDKEEREELTLRRCKIR